MYKSERIIIDTRKYYLDEVLERYKHGLLIFYEKSGTAARARRNKVIWEVLEALARGIPFPPVYVSELQTGELLVLDKSDRLRFLMEYLAYGFEGDSREYSEIEERRYLSGKGFAKDIFYSSIILHVIDYMNPKYMHMQVGAFIEEWSATQEQSIRNILYRKAGGQVFEELLSEIHYPSKRNLNIQYNLIYFIMVSFVALRGFDHLEYQNADKFRLLEETMYGLQHKDYNFLKDLYSRFEYVCYLFNEKDYRDRLLPQLSAESRTKYLCFMGAWLWIRDEHDLEEMFGNRRIRNLILHCDMGYEGINRILEDFREH